MVKYYLKTQTIINKYKLHQLMDIKEDKKIIL